MKRIFDLAMAGFLFCFLSVPIFVVGLIVKLTSRGPALYWSDRVGVGNQIFVTTQVHSSGFKVRER